MVEFIKETDTPLTIGLQGQWGSGKTSLMNMIREEIEKNDLSYAWVNTWEYSLFRSVSETIPSLLKGLIDDLTRNVKSLSKDERVKKVGNFLKKLAKNTLAVTSQHLIGSDITKVFEDEQGNVLTISDIKKEIQEIVKKVVENGNNPYKKVIFFIDDLDRIEPSVAVEVLESLKNLFDVKNAVFILAIDYDVVVKGLEKKFGKKTQENEREFSSFFDKIIQVPFSMPINQYKIDDLLERHFQTIGISISENLKSSYINIVKYTVGLIPRSIKRYINTYSLLTKIYNKEENIDTKDTDIDDSNENNNQLKSFVLFSLIGLQIAYPKVYQLLVKKSDFLGWNDEFLKMYHIKLAELSDKEKENELLDEEWEQVLYSFCQNNNYLKTRVFDIIRAFNDLREICTDDKVGEMIEDSLAISNITSVDESSEKQSKQTPEESAINDLKDKVKDTFKDYEWGNPGKFTLKTYKNNVKTSYSFYLKYIPRTQTVILSIREDKKRPSKIKNLTIDLENIIPKNIPNRVVSTGKKDLCVNLPVEKLSDILSEEFQNEVCNIFTIFRDKILPHL